MGNFIWVDSFHYATSQLSSRYSAVGSALTIGAYGRLGENGVQQPNTTTASQAELAKTITARATVDVGFALDLYAGYPGGTSVLLVFKEGATVHVTIAMLTDGTLRAFRGNASGTTLGTSSSAVPSSGYPHLEFQVTINDSTGVVKIWIDGVLVLNLTGQDTRNGGASSVVDTVTMYRDGATNPLQSRFSDYFIHEDTQQGDVHLETLDPDADGDSSQFVGSDGNNTNNYALVAKATPNVTTYVEEDTATQTDLYNVESLSIGSASVKCVAVETWDQKTDAGTCTFSHTVKSSSTTSDSSNFSPGTSATYHQSLWHTDPATGSAWTVSGVNAMQAGATRQS